MEKVSKQISSILIRYTIMVIIALPNLWIFYFVFTPLTIYLVYFLLNLFFHCSLTGNFITLENRFLIELINACIAGSAYYFLFILNLSTPKIKFKKRVKMILLSFASLLIINILRIFLLSLVLISGSSWFDITHKFFWYFTSIIFVIGIWFIQVKLFKIKEIPFYSDISFLYEKSNLKK